MAVFKYQYLERDLSHFFIRLYIIYAFDFYGT